MNQADTEIVIQTLKEVMASIADAQAQTRSLLWLLEEKEPEETHEETE